jgi:hypothetical protein
VNDNYNSSNPNPQSPSDFYGTAIASVIGANANNQKCSVGKKFIQNFNK